GAIGQVLQAAFPVPKRGFVILPRGQFFGGFSGVQNEPSLVLTTLCVPKAEQWSSVGWQFLKVDGSFKLQPGGGGISGGKILSAGVQFAPSAMVPLVHGTVGEVCPCAQASAGASLDERAIKKRDVAENQSEIAPCVTEAWEFSAAR